jgi:hypothetical protein
MLITIATLLLLPPPAGFSVKKDTVKIEPVVLYDSEGQKQVTEQPYLQIRLTVTNEADRPLAWPGFHRARVSYYERTAKLLTGGAVLPVKFGPGPNCRWEQSVVTDQIVKPGQKTTVLVIFDRPGTGGQADLTLQWKGGTPGWNSTLKSGFRLPPDKYKRVPAQDTAKAGSAQSDGLTSFKAK